MSAHIASSYANSRANDLVAPLLKKGGGGTDTVATTTSDAQQNSIISEPTIKPTATTILRATTVALVSAAGVASSIAAFLVSPAIIVYVAGGMCLANVPVVLYKERKMALLPALRNTVNELREMSRTLQGQVDSLQKELDDLNTCAMRQVGFEGVENELQELATTQGTNVERLVDLVSENEQILFLMRENLRQKVLQDVISIVVRTDRDNTQRIDKVEAKLLALKITVKLEVYGIFFDQDKFLMAVALNPTLAGVICTIRKLMPEVDENGNPCDDQSSKSDDSYFLDEDDMYDMFYMSRDEQRKRGSVMALRAAFHGQKGVSLARLGEFT
eukprot:g2863.t1 g2863   contig12:940887-942046(+)